MPRWSNADGLTGNLFATGTDDSGLTAATLTGIDFGLHNQHAHSVAFGTLVGSINNNFFSIGTSFNGVATATGELLLWYWDSNFSDNSESIQLAVTTVSEPAIVVLFAAGLAGPGFARRSKKQAKSASVQLLEVVSSGMTSLFSSSTRKPWPGKIFVT